MSKKLIRGVLSVAAIVVNVIPGIGQLASLAITAGIGILNATVLKPRAPKVSPNATDRLVANLVPDTPRKIALGSTALATDVRYQGFTGTDQEYYHMILCVASHRIEAIDEIWFDSERAWSSSSGVVSKYSGYLTVTTRLEGTSGNAIAIDSVWTSSCRLTGCAYIHMRYKRTGNSKKAESPFAQTIPTRITVRGKGAFLPDVRESGCDAADQSTWDWFDADSGNNPAMQLLFYLLGWRINGKLAVGRGIPVGRIDLDSFIDAANLCDEPVTKAAGGTEPRYRSAGVFSEGDDAGLVIGGLCAAMNAVLRDVNGKIGVYVLHNDLASPVASFSEADIIDGDSWEQTPPIAEIENVVRGRWTDPSNGNLYQLVDYPEVRLTSVDGIDRIDQFDQPLVQSVSQAQRIAKTRLQRNLYPGVFSANFHYRAWQVNLGDIVELSHLSLGWVDKLFRVKGQTISLDGICALVLQEEHEDIYAWDAEEAPAVEPAVPTAYDATTSPLVQAIDEIELTPGPGGLSAILTNESHTLAAASDGTVSSYAGAEGDFVVFAGSEDVSANFALSTQANPQSLSVTYTDQHYEVTGGLDAGEAGAVLTIRATGSGDYAGVTIDKDFTLAKSLAGDDGTSPPLITLTSTVFAANFDSDGNYTGGDITFTSIRTNTTETPVFRLYSPDGTLLHGNTAAGWASTFPSAWSSTGDDDLTVTAASIGGTISTYGGFRMEASVTGAADSISATRVNDGQDGVDGAINGPALITVEADYAGTIGGDELPRLDLFTYLRNGADVTEDSDWDVDVVSGSWSGSIDDGVLETTALGTVEAQLLVTAEYEAPAGTMTRSYNVTVRRHDAQTPVGGGGGAGSGGTLVSLTSFSGIASTSMTVISGTLQPTVGSAGKVKINASLSIKSLAASPDGTFECEAIVQELISGVWTDIGSATATSPDPSVSEVPFGPGGYTAFAGSVSIEHNLTGRTPAATPEFRLRARCPSSSRSFIVSGNFVADGTVS